jgi:hypothetical protein
MADNVWLLDSREMVSATHLLLNPYRQLSTLGCISQKGGLWVGAIGAEGTQVAFGICRGEGVGVSA